MKTNRPINDCYCYNCRKYEQCRDEGMFDEGRDIIDFCVDYEDVRSAEMNLKVEIDRINNLKQE